MPDNLNRRGPEDPNKINLKQDHEVSYWTGFLGVSKDVLQRAVRAVGPMVKDVRKWLQENGHQ
jgi:Protein of unknown function (DUF3606)